jgi:hypothetical protein
MGWKSEEHHRCEKLLELAGGGQEQCNTPTLANNSFCWEHQPQPDGKRQTLGWTAEQIEHAWEFGAVRIVDDRIVGFIDIKPGPRHKRDDEPDGGIGLATAAGA